MKKVFLILFVLLLTFSFAKIKIVFWTAPNPDVETFWKQVVAEYEQLYPDIDIEWTTIPAVGSSEEAILNAIAAGEAPDICTNIFSGFAAQLIELDQLVDLSKLPGFDGLLKKRNMENIIKGWEFNGKSYVFPIYTNPILVWWRKDILEKYGWKIPPRTYSDVYEFAKQFSIPNKKYAMKLYAGKNWWDRWFDYISYYYAASDGKPYIDTKNNKAIFDNDAGLDVAKFFETMFKNRWSAVDLGKDPFFTGSVAGGLKGPWTLSYAQIHYPDIIKDIIITPPLVPDNYPKDKSIHTFADTKGLVIFKSSKHQKEAWEFVKWVFSHSEYDKLWIELTKQPPAREDLLTNDLFAKFFEKNPLVAKYAEYVGYAVPPALTSKTVEVQDEMGVSLLEPIIYGKTNAERAIKNAVKNINRLLW
ncbi:carbohydrate ABC transporter substrate-binding protein, CUT1 family [Marinitoga hydrogenitolerans DSM 16785]|uniref:Carbohydrate ABC transporter substrate-binding protein, CUT1 family n=1 Tax=Marinitoga hydrogenitolerans (strain DSM 16785 / JCM 12826 / AT1271) TaxID=1122195 RepID=A0A1M4SJB8_MARH1|nr:extracellular solute-binding protein [Marinitoga hydrogenitolerans]SHE32242.1 carbohydrate ABC transporter substrate-binding protein, CUT1 family [Marinitoga hydrogenitolerans DSM 16785]